MKNKELIQAIESAANDKMNVSQLSDYGLSIRCINALEQANIISLRELIDIDEEQILELSQIGTLALIQIKKAIVKLGQEIIIKQGGFLI